MKDREFRLYAKVLQAGTGSKVECRPNDWRDAQSLVCQGLIELVGERSPHGFFAVRATEQGSPTGINDHSVQPRG
jgi:hypothetical protein